MTRIHRPLCNQKYKIPFGGREIGLHLLCQRPSRHPKARRSNAANRGGKSRFDRIPQKSWVDLIWTARIVCHFATETQPTIAALLFMVQFLVSMPASKASPETDYRMAVQDRRVRKGQQQHLAESEHDHLLDS